MLTNFRRPTTALMAAINQFRYREMAGSRGKDDSEKWPKCSMRNMVGCGSAYKHPAFRVRAQMNDVSCSLFSLSLFVPDAGRPISHTRGQRNHLHLLGDCITSGINEGNR